LNWKLAASFGRVDIHIPLVEEIPGGAVALAKEVQASIDYLYPPDQVASPIGRVELYLVPEGYGASSQHLSIGGRGELSARFYFRKLGALDGLSQITYSAGTVAHELVHIQRRLAGVAVGPEEESIASLIEACALLHINGEFSPTYSSIALNDPSSKREDEVISSARAAADLARSLPATVYAGSDIAQELMDACGKHWGPIRDE
jgi:hypothetical protein